jgi:hypothetical protein
MLKPIRLNASNVAALINKNPYVKRSDAILAAWRSSDKHSYEKAHARNETQTIEDRRREIQEATPFIVSNLSGRNASVMDVVESGGVRDLERQSLHTDAAQEARRLMFTKYGEARERSIIDRVRDIMPQFDFQTDGKMYRKVIGQTRSGRDIILQGKIDGISKDKTTILEAKTRMHRLFLKLREYEHVQTRCYLELIPESSKALLVEAHFETSTPNINIIQITKKYPMLDIDFMHSLQLAGELVGLILDNPHIQDTFILSKQKDNYVKRLAADLINVSIE